MKVIQSGRQIVRRLIIFRHTCTPAILFLECTYSGPSNFGRFGQIFWRILLLLTKALLVGVCRIEMKLTDLICQLIRWNFFWSIVWMLFMTHHRWLIGRTRSQWESDLGLISQSLTSESQLWQQFTHTEFYLFNNCTVQCLELETLNTAFFPITCEWVWLA